MAKKKRLPPLRMGESADWDGETWIRVRPLGTLGRYYMRMRRKSDGKTMTLSVEFVRENMKAEERRTS